MRSLLATVVALWVCACGGETPAVIGPIEQAEPCAPGTVPLDDGGCRSAGVPPERCGTGFEPDGDGGCRALLPDASCERGELAAPGDTSCRPVADCGSGTWGNIAREAGTQHVDASYADGGSDGSAERPWTRIQQGVDAAAAGATVAIAAGSYAENVTVLGKPVRLWGRCPQLVDLQGVDGYYWALSFETGSSDSAARSLSIRGPIDGLLVSGATGIVIEEVWIHDTGEWGINIQNALGPAQATVRRSLVEAAHAFGVFVDGEGADLLVDRSVVRDVAGTSEHGGDAMLVQRDGRLRVTQSLIEGAPQHAVRAVDGMLELYGLYVRDPQPSEVPAGILVSADIDSGEPSEATIDGTVIERADGIAIHTVAARALVDATVVRGTRGRGIVGSGYLDVAYRPELSIRDSLVAQAEEVGVLMLGGVLSVEGSVVRDVQPAPRTGKHGLGISVQVERAIRLPSQAVVRDSLIERATTVGVLCTGSELAVEHTHVRDTRPQRALQGKGIHVQHDTAVDLPATLVLTDVLVERSYLFGIGAQNAAIRAERVTVLDTFPQESDGRFGDGVALISDRGIASTLLAMRVERSARAGIASFGASGALGSSLLSCNTVHLVAEPNYGTPGFIESLGDNTCACGSEETLCKAVGARLEPPPELDD